MGNGSIVAPIASVSGSGGAIQQITGTGAISAAPATMAGAAITTPKVTVTGTGAITTPAVQVDGIDLMEEIRQDMEARITPYIGVATDTDKAVGISYGLYTPDHGQFARGLGLKETGGAAVDGDTLFCLGSVTKVFTAYAFAKAKVDGDMGWATKLNTLLDDTPDDIDNDSRITMRMLVAHRSGLLSFPDNMGDDLSATDFEQQPGKGYTRAKLATDIAAGNSGVDGRTPGAAFLYSNYGYGYIGMALQDYYGYSNDMALLDAKVFTPLSMSNTSDKSEPFMTNTASDQAQGYMNDGTAAPFPDMGIMAAAGEFISSANDMLLFLKELADQSSSTSTEMQVEVFTGGYGYGHAITTATDGEELRYKGGGTAAYSSAIAWRENPNIGVVVLSNKGGINGDLVTLAQELLDDAVALLP